MKSLLDRLADALKDILTCSSIGYAKNEARIALAAIDEHARSTPVAAEDVPVAWMVRRDYPDGGYTEWLFKVESETEVHKEMRDTIIPLYAAAPTKDAGKDEPEFVCVASGVVRNPKFARENGPKASIDSAQTDSKSIGGPKGAEAVAYKRSPTKHWSVHPQVSEHRMFDDDLPLYTHPPRAAEVPSAAVEQYDELCQFLNEINAPAMVLRLNRIIAVLRERPTPTAPVHAQAVTDAREPTMQECADPNCPECHGEGSKMVDATDDEGNPCGEYVPCDCLDINRALAAPPVELPSKTQAIPVTRDELVRIRNSACGVDYVRISSRMLDLLCSAVIETLDAASLSGATAAADGMVLVPREPTDTMLHAGMASVHVETENGMTGPAFYPLHIYRAMVKAALADQNTSAELPDFSPIFGQVKTDSDGGAG